MKRTLALAGLGAILSTSTPALAGNPWEELMGPEKPKPWMDPEGRFTIGLPIGWTAKPRAGTPVVDLWKTNPDYGATAHVTVEVRPLPPGVLLAHLSMRILDEVKTAARNLRVLETDRTTLAGVPAERRLLTYQERGHAELTNEVVQVMAVAGERGFVVTLETAFGARGIFWEDFNKMLKGFGTSAAPAAEGGKGEVPAAEDGVRRKRVRAGEMVNPEELKY